MEEVDEKTDVKPEVIVYTEESLFKNAKIIKRFCIGKEICLILDTQYGQVKISILKWLPRQFCLIVPKEFGIPINCELPGRYLQEVTDKWIEKYHLTN